MICPCLEVMTKRLQEVGLYNAGFQNVDIDLDSGEASLVIPLLVNTPLAGRPDMKERHVIGIIGKYCPFCGRYLGEEEENNDEEGR